MNNKDYVGVKIKKDTRGRFKILAIKAKLSLIEYLDKLSKELSK